MRQFCPNSFIKIPPWAIFGCWWCLDVIICVISTIVVLHLYSASHVRSILLLVAPYIGKLIYRKWYKMNLYFKKYNKHYKRHGLYRDCCNTICGREYCATSSTVKLSRNGIRMRGINGYFRDPWLWFFSAHHKWSLIFFVILCECPSLWFVIGIVLLAWIVNWVLFFLWMLNAVWIQDVEGGG